MRLRDVPVAESRGLVMELTEAHAQRNLVQRSANFRSEGAVYTGLPPRISSRLDRAGIHFADELVSAGTLIRRMRLDRLRIDDGAADVAQGLVHRMRKRMNRRRLAFAGDDQASAAAFCRSLTSGPIQV